MYELSRQMCRDSTVHRLTEKERLIGERGKQVQRAVERRGDWKQWRGGLVWRKSLLIGEQTRRAAGVGK